MKKLTPQQTNALIIKKQREACTLCDHRGVTFHTLGFEKFVRPCECTVIKKPQIEPTLPFKDDMGDITLSDILL
jgi:hypothetical protein